MFWSWLPSHSDFTSKQMSKWDSALSCAEEKMCWRKVYCENELSEGHKKWLTRAPSTEMVKHEQWSCDRFGIKEKKHNSQDMKRARQEKKCLKIAIGYDAEKSEVECRVVLVHSFLFYAAPEQHAERSRRGRLQDVGKVSKPHQTMKKFLVLLRRLISKTTKSSQLAGCSSLFLIEPRNFLEIFKFQSTLQYLNKKKF